MNVALRYAEGIGFTELQSSKIVTPVPKGVLAIIQALNTQRHSFHSHAFVMFLKTWSIPKFLQAQYQNHISLPPRPHSNPTSTPQAEQHKYLPRHFCPYSQMPACYQLQLPPQYMQPAVHDSPRILLCSVAFYMITPVFPFPTWFM